MGEDQVQDHQLMDCDLVLHEVLFTGRDDELRLTQAGAPELIPAKQPPVVGQAIVNMGTLLPGMQIPIIKPFSKRILAPPVIPPIPHKTPLQYKGKEKAEEINNKAVELATKQYRNGVQGGLNEDNACIGKPLNTSTKTNRQKGAWQRK